MTSVIVLFLFLLYNQLTRRYSYRLSRQRAQERAASANPLAQRETAVPARRDAARAPPGGIGLVRRLWLEDARNLLVLDGAAPVCVEGVEELAHDRDGRVEACG